MLKDREVNPIMRIKLYAPAATAMVAVGLWQGRAAACAACFAASDAGTRLGYYVSTAILSLTPILIMGSMVTYVAVKYSRANKQRDRR